MDTLRMYQNVFLMLMVVWLRIKRIYIEHFEKD